MSDFENLIGKKFGHRIVIGEAHDRIYSGQKYRYWKCKCKCGRIDEVREYELKRGEAI